MEQQQQSNNIRIKILEQENFTLHKSLEKLRQRGMLNITKVRIWVGNVRYDEIRYGVGLKVGMDFSTVAHLQKLSCDLWMMENCFV